MSKTTKKSNNTENTVNITNTNEKNTEIIKTTKKSNNTENTVNITNTNEKNTEIIKTSNVHLPYINTYLLCPIMLHPNQMDNKLYLHLKSNLINKLEGKCYKNYGYINKIYSIDEISDGIIEAEDPSCSAKMVVKFTCNLCLPIINKELICKIDRMNKSLISAINGPIKVIITADKINKDNFYPDMNRNIRIKGNSEVLIPNMYIRILILSKSFSDYDKNILVIGFMQDIATNYEIKEFMHIDTNDINESINEII